MKTIIITGSTDGIGKLAAIDLAKEGHEIYLHGRNPQKLTAVVEEIKQLSNNERVDGFVADFSDLDAVKEMAQQIKQKLSKIDVLVNNAGIFKSAQSENKDGLDIRMVVNYLAPYLLTEALPRQLASELCLLGRSISATRLANAGVVNQTTAPGSAREAALNLAACFDKGPAKAVSLIKSEINAAKNNSLAEQLFLEAVNLNRARYGPEGREGVAAFLEKRKPEF